MRAILGAYLHNSHVICVFLKPRLHASSGRGAVTLPFVLPCVAPYICTSTKDCIELAFSHTGNAALHLQRAMQQTVLSCDEKSLSASCARAVVGGRQLISNATS